MTGEIVSAYVGKAKLGAPQVVEIITRVHAALANLKDGIATASTTQEVLRPAISIRKSITPDYIICLEDGKKLRMLKRHLRTTYGLSPDEYRTRWGLPGDYPMVAPSYAKQRSDFAKKIGLGRTAPRRGRKAAS